MWLLSGDFPGLLGWKMQYFRFYSRVTSESMSAFTMYNFINPTLFLKIMKVVEFFEVYLWTSNLNTHKGRKKPDPSSWFVLYGSPFSLHILTLHTILQPFMYLVKIRLFFLCTLGFYLYVCQCEDVRSPGTGVTHSCEQPCGCSSSGKAASAFNQWAIFPAPHPILCIL